jgi:hypothetical protein
MFKYGDLIKHIQETEYYALGVVTKVTDIGLPKFAKSQVLEVKWLSGNWADQSYYNTSLELVVRGKNDERL